jgi:hypothetical protein
MEARPEIPVVLSRVILSLSDKSMVTGAPWRNGYACQASRAALTQASHFGGRPCLKQAVRRMFANSVVALDSSASPEGGP